MTQLKFLSSREEVKTSFSKAAAIVWPQSGFLFYFRNNVKIYEGNLCRVSPLPVKCLTNIRKMSLLIRPGASQAGSFGHSFLLWRWAMVVVFVRGVSSHRGPLDGRRCWQTGLFTCSKFVSLLFEGVLWSTTHLMVSVYLCSSGMQRTRWGWGPMKGRRVSSKIASRVWERDEGVVERNGRK